MSQHTRVFLTVLGCAVCVVALLVIVSACVEPVGPFDNPYDPENPESPFSYDVYAESGTGRETTMTAAAEVTFEWSAVDHATMYHLQVARDGAFSDMVHDDEVPAETTAVEVELEVGSRYFWRVRYEAEVTHKGTTSESWGLWCGPWEVTVASEDSGDNDEDDSNASGAGRFVMAGSIDGQSVSIDTSEPLIIPFDGGDGFRLMSPDDEHGIGFDVLGDFSGAGAYNVEFQLEGTMGIWATSLFSTHGFNTVPADAGTIIFHRLDDERWSGEYVFRSRDDIDYDLSGSFDIDVNPITIPDSAYVFEIPTATITVDGSPDDWNGIKAHAVDDADDTEAGRDHTDIRNVYLARDDNYLYWRMDLADGPERSGDPISYRLYARPSDDDRAGEYELSVLAGGNETKPILAIRDEAIGEWRRIDVPATHGAVGEVVEGRLELAYFAERRYISWFWQTWADIHHDHVHPDSLLDFRYTGDQEIPDNAPPGPVRNLAGSWVNGNIRLTWTDPSDEDLDRISVTWSPGEGGPSTVVAGQEHIDIPDFKLGTGDHEFLVRSIDDAGYTSEAVFVAVINYTVTYDANGADGGTPPAATTDASGATVTLPGAGTLTRTGLVFAGWNTQPDGSGTSYSTGSSYTIPGVNVTLYAQWTEMPIMVEVPGGTFNTNGTDVTISAFRISQYEITQAQYQAVMASNPSSFTGDTSRPVENVNWYDAIVFCNMLSMMEGRTPVYTIDGSTAPADWGAVPTSQDATWNAATMDFGANGYRLPTDAEWEYAAKGGEPVEGYTYAGSDTIDDVAWYTDNSGSTTHPVGQKQPNRLGLYDMSGNVFEWTWVWHSDTYPSGTTDPTGAASGTYRVKCGGAWNDGALECTVASRNSNNPYVRSYDIGLRVVCR